MRRRSSREAKVDYHILYARSKITRSFPELRERRQKRLAEALDRVPPSSEESALLHTMQLKYRSDVWPMLPVDGIEPVPIRDTHMENTLMMYPQERNVHSKVFGGRLTAKPPRYHIDATFRLSYAPCL